MAVPYVLQIKNGVNAIRLTDLDKAFDDTIPHLTYLSDLNTSLEQFPMPILAPIEVNKSKDTANIQLQSNEDIDPQINYVYRVVYPDQVTPQPAKRGRKKKKKIEEPEEVREEPIKILKSAPRTRSGRVVKFPKHMEKDFKKVEIKDTKKPVENEEEIITDFVTFKEEPPSKQTELPLLNFHQRRRKIAAQYRCPKCLKAYLGKTKMIQHIKKYPDHGPLPQKESSKVNFEVWNYLVDITQRCTPAQRGIKFCEELTNLLHNVLLLTSALFKKVEHNKNFVEVDKVLGNAIGLSPGFYTFNDSELYKDVTVLKLITTTDFFKPVNSTTSQTEKSITASPQEIEKNTVIVKKESVVVAEPEHGTKKIEPVYFNSREDLRKDEPSFCMQEIEPKIVTDLADIPDEYGKKDENLHIDSELLSHHSLLHLSAIRNTEEDLMLTSVDPGGTLLDNSTSSDEVMNVDQFVNERFKKITEPDLELGTSSLNLDLPSLDLFQFHAT